MADIICPQCGNSLADNALVCPRCMHVFLKLEPPSDEDDEEATLKRRFLRPSCMRQGLMLRSSWPCSLGQEAVSQPAPTTEKNPATPDSITEPQAGDIVRPQSEIDTKPLPADFDPRNDAASDSETGQKD